MTDLPETRMYLDLDGAKLATTIHGLMRANTKLPAYTTFPSDREGDRLPASVSELYDYLTQLDFPGATRWEPERVEVMVWDYSYAPEESISWPSEWPGLDAPSTVRRGDSYSVFLPGTELPRLRELLRARRQRGAVEIDGRNWAVAIRYPFPGESVWLNALARSD